MNESIVEEYCSCNCKKLYEMVDKIRSQFGGISQKDYDEFYSLAHEVFTIAIRDYQADKASFDTFLYHCLSNKIRSEITKRNRIKRSADREAISLDMPLGDDMEDTLESVIPSKVNVADEAIANVCAREKSAASQYLEKLSNLQRRILFMRMSGKTNEAIQKELGLSRKQFDAQIASMRMSDKIRVLTRSKSNHLYDNKSHEKRKEKQPMANTTTYETTKTDLYKVSDLADMFASGDLRDDHPQQRQSDQWTNKAKGDLIVTACHKYSVPSIIVAEQVINNVPINWLIDGKQRCTTFVSYLNNEFKISRSCERSVVSYTKQRLDENGKPMFGERGVPVYDTINYDMRGKAYKDLPDELKRRIGGYCIGVTQYLNCSDDDIEYHIRRYNQGKAMSVSQKGITHIGSEFARLVKRIANHDFFKESGSYTEREFLNGTIDRVITESIMVINFLPHWNKRNEVVCEFLKENANVSHFEKFERLLDRMYEIIDDDTAHLFNSKDSFIWFAAFDRFTKVCNDDDKFADFVKAFVDELHELEVDGTSYDGIVNATRGTKDTTIVNNKINMIETLMLNYINIEKAPEFSAFEMVEDASHFVDRFADHDVVVEMNITSETELIRTAMTTLMSCCGMKDTSDEEIQASIDSFGSLFDEELQDEVELYMTELDEWNKLLSEPSGLLSPRNLPALIGTIAYLYREDYSEKYSEQWFVTCAKNYPVGCELSGNIRKDTDKLIASLTAYINYCENKAS